jgi:ubiquinone/menaquinone biosynthesis C-methylase UbiE
LQTPQSDRCHLQPLFGRPGLPWPDAHFDLVISINALHNLYNYELDASLREIDRVGRGAKYLCVEAYATSGRR